MIDRSSSLRQRLCSGLLAWLLPVTALATSYPLPPPGEDLIGELATIRADSGETLLDVARRHGVGHDAIVAANPGIDPWLPQDGARITLPTQFILPDAPREGIVINLPEMRLYYYPAPAAGQPPTVITHPISIGSEGRNLPIGLSRIGEKRVDPNWVVPASIRAEHARDGDPLPAVVPPGPDNPLGRFAMRLDTSSYLIHGTNRPFSIGMRVSHGCIRMYPQDIESLFPQVPVGTPVRIVNQPFKAGWRDDELYVEAHAPLQEEHLAPASGPATTMVATVIGRSNLLLDETSWRLARRAAEQQQGIPTRIRASQGAHSLLHSVTRHHPDLTPGATWWLQLGAYGDYHNARRIARQLGQLPTEISTNLVTNGRLCHLLVGPFRAREVAQNMGEVIHQHTGFSGFALSGAALNGFRFCDAPA